MKTDTINHAYWHPKYKNTENPDYNMDWLWNESTPKKVSEQLNVKIIELQVINDSLSYVKIQVSNKLNDKLRLSIYKYYIIEKEGKYYLDNCREYDSNKFKHYSTPNIEFFVSYFYKNSPLEISHASKSVDSLCAALHVKKKHKKINYYMCATEEELNNLINIVSWSGGLTGFTNMVEGTIVGINQNPLYPHEFVHAILGYGANCFFLQEGVATLFGGSGKNTFFNQEVVELKNCFKTKKCTFDTCYKRAFDSQYNSKISYVFAAMICKYIINTLGYTVFYQLYYDKSITSDNLLEKISTLTGKDKKAIQTEIESLIQRS